MKKATWILGAAAAALLASGAPLTIRAVTVGPGTEAKNLNTTVDASFALATDADTAEANSVAQFTIEAGQLALKAVPNLHFANGEVADLTSHDATFELVDGNVNPGDDGYDGNAEKKIQVLDYRGTNTGWTLNAKIGDFSNKKTTITPKNLTLTGEVAADNDPGSLSNANIVGQGATLLSPAASHGSGSTVVTLNAAPLDLPKTTQVTPGDYRAQITWTLLAAPTTTAP